MPVLRSENTFLCGDGTLLRNVHTLEECAMEYCVVHNPSEHPMVGWKTGWRRSFDTPIGGHIVRQNPETGEWVIDPDDLAFNTYMKETGRW